MKIYQVHEFIDHLNANIASEIYVVEGEVSGFSISQSKWVFFDLKDERGESKVGCFMVAFRLKVPLEDGMKVRVIGTPKIHEKSGQFRIMVEAIELSGEGALKRAFELLKKKLAEEGLFAPERKRPLPRFPQTIGIIASRESAAYGDFMRILGNRWAGITILLAHVQVQGERAIHDISGAFKYFNGAKVKPEVLVLIRGGGSLEDLQAFNSEEVARAIFSSKIPVVVGVGHERDETIADYVADVRASTPSNAAERAVPERKEIEYAISSMLRATTASFTGFMEDKRNAFKHFALILQGYLREKKARLENLLNILKSLSPREVLARGYAMVKNEQGKILRNSSGVALNEVINVQLAKGTLSGKVIGKT